MGDKGSEIRIFLADTGEEVAMAKALERAVRTEDAAVRNTRLEERMRE